MGCSLLGSILCAALRDLDRHLAQQQWGRSRRAQRRQRAARSPAGRRQGWRRCRRAAGGCTTAGTRLRARLAWPATLPTFRASSISCAAGTTRDTRPMRSASAALMRSPAGQVGARNKGGQQVGAARQGADALGFGGADAVACSRRGEAGRVGRRPRRSHVAGPPPEPVRTSPPPERRAARAVPCALPNLSAGIGSTGAALARRQTTQPTSCSTTELADTLPSSTHAPVRTSSMARLLPTARARRCVPPMPGMTPMVISG